jgi:hypothetical protein
MRANLASDGVLVFDVNTLTTYRTFFGREMVREHNGHRLVWKGLVRPHAVVPGVIAEADVEEIGNPSTAHRHRQRHFPVPDVLAAVEVAGLRCLEVIGEHDGELSNPVDEERHGKVVFVCKASSTAGASA